MSHMVIYRSVEGKPGFQQTDDLVSAVEFVERLRNLEGVESARIYRLEQVNFRFQPYYQVHIETEDPPAPPPTPAADGAPAEPFPVFPAANASYAAPAYTSPAHTTPGPEDIEEEREMLAAGPVLTPVLTAEAAPLPPPVPTAVSSTPAGPDHDEGPADHPELDDPRPTPAIPGLSSTMPPPVEPPAEAGGVRRGLFNR
ncbi:MAG: hypothetical protein ACKV2O_12825 [Acidimicrobiales bacterium]